MEDWFIEYPDLLKKEIEELKNNGILVDDKIDFESFNKEGVILYCTISVKNNLGLNLESDLGLKIIFPSNYPYFRPEVFVTTDTILPRHQNPQGKNLCLIPRPTQFWNVGVSVYDHLKERLAIVFDKGLIVDQEIIGQDPEEQAEPVSEYYVSNTNAVILSARPNIENKELPVDNKPFRILDHGYLDFSYNKNNPGVELFKDIELKEGLALVPMRSVKGENLKIVIKEWRDSAGEIIGKYPYRDFPQSMITRETTWYKISSLQELFDNVNNFEWLIEELKKNNVPLPRGCNINTENYVINNMVGLVFPEEEVAGKIDWGWLLFVDGYIFKKIRNKGISRLSKSLILPIMSVDQSDLSDRIPMSKSLKGKTISVIGLGSLGAPSVLEFAKNGVSKLKLMDFDIVDFTTSVRWPLGIESAGSLKAVALKKFIDKNYPGVQVEIFNHKIGSTDFLSYPNENKILEDFMKDSSLVYDASAEEGVSNLISFLCKTRNIPYVEIEGRRGAWGGLVMRVLPETNKGCWMCLQYSLYVDKVIPLPKEDDHGTIQPKGCGDPTFTGSSFDLQNISLAGVRMAISSLSEDTNNGDWDVAVLSIVDNKEQPIAPQWNTSSLEINTKCPFCNANSLD
jgi:molybdopterin/thiamine biosynthesis adenylyltransferase